MTSLIDSINIENIALAYKRNLLLYKIERFNRLKIIFRILIGVQCRNCKVFIPNKIEKLRVYGGTLFLDNFPGFPV